MKLQEAHEDVREAEATSEANLRSIKDWQERAEKEHAEHSDEVAELRQSLAAIQQTLRNERDANVQLRLEVGQSQAKVEVGLGWWPRWRQLFRHCREMWIERVEID